LTHLPVVLDPSTDRERSWFGAGRRAGVAIGADALIVKCIPSEKRSATAPVADLVQIQQNDGRAEAVCRVVEGIAERGKWLRLRAAKS